ncbi:MAG TPA: helix-turn-helix domain-containing protein [Pyrinomonadaceae bacterium]|jgi:AcrR family transcriptional regulator
MSKQAETVRAENPPATPPSTSPVSSSSSGRMAGEERRRQLVAVAMRVFSERGFRGTTTKEIAQAAGVSEGIIFRHFATKEELYTAIIDYKACTGVSHLNQSVAEAIHCSVAEAIQRKDDRAVFEGVALHLMQHHENDTEFLRLLFYSALEGHQLSQIFWDRNVRLMYEFLGAYIRERQHEGVFRPVDPLVVVRAFSGMLIHHSVTNILWDTSRSLLDISNEAAAREFTEILLRGIAADANAATSSATTTTTTTTQPTRRDPSKRGAAALPTGRAKKKK